MPHRLALWIPDLSITSAIAWMGGIIGAGWGASSLFGVGADSAPVWAMATTVVGGLLLVWRSYVERDARHARKQIQDLTREVAHANRKLKQAGIHPIESND